MIILNAGTGSNAGYFPCTACMGGWCQCRPSLDSTTCDEQGPPIELVGGVRFVLEQINQPCGPVRKRGKGKIKKW